MPNLVSDPIRIEVCEEAEKKILEILNSTKLNLRELIWLLGQLSIDIGATLQGKKSLPDYDQIRRDYYADPNIGTALCAQGADVHTLWLKLEKDYMDDDKKENRDE